MSAVPEWIFQIVGVVGAMGATYAAIRADLAELRVKAEVAVQRADDAHKRIDGFFQHKGA